MSGPASGIADGRPGTESLLELVGERGQQGSIQRLVAQFVENAVDIGVGDRVIADTDT